MTRNQLEDMAIDIALADPQLVKKYGEDRLIRLIELADDEELEEFIDGNI